MAEVFLARERAGGRLVVIKRLRRHLVEAKNLLGMFIDEIQVTARLDHPNVVKLTEPGYSLAEWFLVLEPIAGLPLSKLLRRLTEFTYGSSALSPGAVALLGGQIASGLHHAHTLRDEGGNPMNVVHRDVSPENIMVTFLGQAKLIDFGVAKLTGGAGHTRPGDVKGKLGYMAPEQVLPTERITHRTDVFALGVVLWEMLTGKRLFLRKSRSDSLRALLEEPVTHPGQLRPIEPILDEIVMRALCKDPGDRFGDAGEMAAALLGVVGADRKGAEAELTEKLDLVRHARPEDFAAGFNERAGNGADPDSGTTMSGSTVRRRPPTAGTRTMRTTRAPDTESERSFPPPGPPPRPPIEDQDEPPPLPGPPRARDLGRRIWRDLPRPLVAWGLAALLLLDIGLRLLGLGSAAAPVATARAPGAASLGPPPARTVIVEPMPSAAPRNPPPGDPIAVLSEAGPFPVPDRKVRSDALATGRHRRSTDQSHPARAARSRSSPPEARSPRASMRRTRSTRSLRAP